MYVLKLVDQTARQKAILLKQKSSSMEQLLDGLKEFIEEKNGIKGVKGDEKT